MTERFVYVTYIRTTPEKLWDALLKPEFTRLYWAGVWHDCDWQQGSSWKLMFPDGRVADTGEVVEIDKPKRLVLKWRNEFRPELRERRLLALHDGDRSGRRGREADDHSRNRQARFQIHRSSLRRLAETPVEPQDPARNRNSTPVIDAVSGG
jgi:uncharacterized protein YndB with AHSA1/START domain